MPHACRAAALARGARRRAPAPAGGSPAGPLLPLVGLRCFVCPCGCLGGWAACLLRRLAAAGSVVAWLWGVGGSPLYIYMIYAALLPSCHYGK
jgi:hypothetical protein